MQRFDLTVGQRLDIDYDRDVLSFSAVEHPGAPGQVHAFSGSEGTVFHLRSIGGDEAALKVFKHRFRTADLPDVAQRLHRLRDIQGLRACERLCMRPSSSQMILAVYPELTFAQVFPWVSGVTWSDIVRLGRPLAPVLSSSIALALVDVLTGFEARGIAHCDLSGPNVMVEVRTGRVEMVDVEHLFAPGFALPSTLVAGTPGYNLVTNFDDVWSGVSDRFAGAILLAEMLGFREAAVVSAACGAGCYFDAAEIGASSSTRYQTLRGALVALSPDLGALLDRVWSARRRVDCPPISEWATALGRLRAAMAPPPPGGVALDETLVAPPPGRVAPVQGTVLLSRVPVSPLAQPIAAAPSPSAATPSGMDAPPWRWVPITDEPDDQRDRKIQVAWQKL